MRLTTSHAGEVLGQDATGRAGRDIGKELDLRWRFPAYKGAGVIVGYSAVFPAAFAEAVRTDRVQSFAYAHLLLKF